VATPNETRMLASVTQALGNGTEPPTMGAIWRIRLNNMKLSYRRGTAQRIMTVEIFSTAAH